jgi:hypothetical protein
VTNVISQSGLLAEVGKLLDVPAVKETTSKTVHTLGLDSHGPVISVSIENSVWAAIKVRLVVCADQLFLSRSPPGLVEELRRHRVCCVWLAADDVGPRHQRSAHHRCGRHGRWCLQLY